MRFVMLINGDESEWSELDSSDAMQQVYGWLDRWRVAGKIAGGEELQPAGTARTVRPGPDGGRVVTDGPYLDLKEALGGFIVLEAENIDEAVEIAASWPDLRGSSSLEVRPVLQR